MSGTPFAGSKMKPTRKELTDEQVVRQALPKLLETIAQANAVGGDLSVVAGMLTELAELIVAISHYMRGRRGSIENLVEEAVDCEIMLTQIFSLVPPELLTEMRAMPGYEQAADFAASSGADEEERERRMVQIGLGFGPAVPVDRDGRDPQDRYYTPDPPIDSLIAFLHQSRSDAPHLVWAIMCSALGVLEPSAGGGSLLRGLHKMLCLLGQPRIRPRVVAVDLDPRPDRSLGFAAADVEWRQGDFRDQVYRPCEFGLSIQNPPFKFAEESVRQSREAAFYTLALLRLTFLESKKRAPWLRADMPDVFVLPDRPAFKGDGGSDMATCAWMLWTPERRSEGRVRLLP